MTHHRFASYGICQTKDNTFYGWCRLEPESDLLSYGTEAKNFLAALEELLAADFFPAGSWVGGDDDRQAYDAEVKRSWTVRTPWTNPPKKPASQ